jgi:hypothetical protein
MRFLLHQSCSKQNIPKVARDFWDILLYYARPTHILNGGVITFRALAFVFSVRCAVPTKFSELKINRLIT